MQMFYTELQLSDQEKNLIDHEIANSKNLKWKKRLKIIRLIAENVYPSQLAKLFNMSENTINEYVKKYSKGGLEALKPIKQTEHNIESEFVICIKNGDYPESLEVMKFYQTIFDPKAIKHQLIRVIDETGEDYLYPQDYFIPVSVPLNAVNTVNNILALQMAKDAVD